MSNNLNNKNIKLARILVFVAVAMFGFGYVLVPFYYTLCKWVGINQPDDVKQVKETSYNIDKNRNINVEFMTMVNEKTPMIFRAETKQLTVHSGEYHTVNFYAENKSDKTIIARATASFTPNGVGEFFEKTQCFCFEKQTFKAHEVKIMPMRFVINPDLPAQHKTITLAYTFFDITDESVK
ncbi:MAG: cytochrome c oxidase assembly protein [Methylococcaceae bacterium]